MVNRVSFFDWRYCRPVKRRKHLQDPGRDYFHRHPTYKVRRKLKLCAMRLEKLLILKQLLSQLRRRQLLLCYLIMPFFWVIGDNFI